jgi:hypothetical protein
MSDLMSQPGANSAVELNNKIQNMQRAYDAPDNLQPSVIGTAVNDRPPQFAARYFQTTKEEENIDLKQKFVRGVAQKMTGNQNNVQVAYTPDQNELDIIKRKQAQGVQYAFHNFVKSMVRPDKSFVNAKYFADHFPDILQKELEEVDTKFEQQKRLAKILIRNQINQEDAAYLFSIATLPADQKVAYIQWLKHPVFLPWDKTTQTKIHNYGKLNPKRLFGRTFSASTPGTLQSFGDQGAGIGDIPNAFMQGANGPTLFPNGTDQYERTNVTNMLSAFFS